MAAKKSNKTEHVLKLITKNQDEEQTAEAEDGVELQEKTEIAGGEEQGDEMNLDMKEKMKEEIKREIKDELKAEEAPEVKAADVKAEEAEEAPEVKAEDVKAEEAPEAKAEDVKAEEAKAEETEPAEAAADVKPDAEKPVEIIMQMDRRGGIQSSQFAALTSESKLLNLAEDLAKEMAPEIMRRMHICPCEACKNDVLALALNALPQKYVTSDSGKQYTKLLNYKNQYGTDVVAALTRACVRVKAAPRHPSGE